VVVFLEMEMRFVSILTWKVCIFGNGNAVSVVVLSYNIVGLCYPNVSPGS
jgi:hypothetical protein